ncbi:hypothetical protein GF325_14895 [Candidatus Bathyarchaeota archaeon]|nr:hypothetical protein [Candidatus Bathyarchaeota archaeon]
MGTLAYLCDESTLSRVKQDDHLKEEFLDLCEIYDKCILPQGFGTRNRAGLFLAGKPAPN